MSHAVLSPSGAHRWLTCTPSARLEQQFPDSGSSFAAEGTLAHTMGELILRYKLKRINKMQYSKQLKTLEADELYEPAMFDHAENYAVFVMERYNEALARTSDVQIFLEHKLNLTAWVPEGFGTGDCVIIADGVMEIIDLKYGKGVQVSAENNKQLMLYALGALHDFDCVYDITSVRMTIFQPRIDNYSSWEISVDELRSWAEEYLKPRAALAFEGEGEFQPGTHCQFCRAKAVCKAFAEFNLEIAKYEFESPELLTDNDITDILTRADMFKNWLKAVEEHALDQAVNHDKCWPGFKLVEGRSNRIYSDAQAVATRLLEAGFAEDVIYTREVKGITAMEKALGKKEFALHLGDLIIKPPGKPTLVPLSDKRPEISSVQSAINDFTDN